MNVTKSNGTLEEFDMEKIEQAYKRVSYGYNTRCPFSALKENINRYIIDDIKTSDINKIIIKSAIDLISTENTAWEFIAWRFTMLNLYKQVTKETGYEEDELYSEDYFVELVKDYIGQKLYHVRLGEYSEGELRDIASHIEKKRDFDYNHTTVTMYEKRYLKNPNKVMRELPQHMYLAIGLFLALPEAPENRLKVAFDIYDACSSWKISLPTPTLLNARTPYCQLSSCFELNVGDDLRNIYHNVENMAQISKFGGWIGVYLGNVRSHGGTIRWVKGTAGWVMPWVKVINDTAIAVNQLGARAWAISVTLDIFHKDIYQFLDMQTETGDIRKKAFDLFPSVSVPDLFMKRMEQGLTFTLFDPKEIEDLYGRRLQDFFGDEFVSFYEDCEQNPDLLLKETVDAKDLFKHYMKSVVETGMPYTFFRDTVNRMNPNKHAGHIYHTNLCVEIEQNTSQCDFVEEVLENGAIVIKYIPWDTVVCNLASINTAKVYTDEEIEKILPIAMRLLDNVIDLNYYPVKEAELTSKKYRPVGLGFLWLAQRLAEAKLNYDTIEAREYVDELFQHYAYAWLRASVDLAKERGAYQLFEWSEWSKGMFNWEKISKKFDLYNEYSRINLQEEMMTYWTRFGYHFAPAPNTSTALVVGTTASVLPIYKKFFTETNQVAPMVNVAPNLNSENFWYYKEYVNMDMNNVIDMMTVIYKWIDQSISFEWYFNPSKISPAILYWYYMKCWKQGIKTIYYVRSASLEVEDCASCSG